MCGLTLISSPHLARSYHHLFPVPPFVEVPQDSLTAAAATAISSVSWYEPGGSSSSAAAAGGSNSSSGVGVYCYGCLKGLGSQEGGSGAAGTLVDLVLRCEQCRQLFCFECDAFIHESLHNCPGCECCGAYAEAEEANGTG